MEAKRMELKRKMIIFYLHSEKLIKLNKINIKARFCTERERRHQLFTFLLRGEDWSENYNWKSFVARKEKEDEGCFSRDERKGEEEGKGATFFLCEGLKLITILIIAYIEDFH